jgi:putative heme-binding domain-containing protein
MANGEYKFTEQALADVPKLSALTFGKDGALYLAHHGVADYWYNSVLEESGGFYKLVYDPALKEKPVKPRTRKEEALSAGSVEAGKQIYAEAACLACHAVDGNTELLGPNLKGLSNRLSREEILEEIENPSRIIKPSMGGLKITKKDGQVLLGRPVHSDEKQISLMLIGNSIVKIPREEIARSDNENKSLMYENLVKNMSPEDVRSLLDYLLSL